MNEYIVGFSKAHDSRLAPQLTRNPRESRDKMSGLCLGGDCAPSVHAVPDVSHRAELPGGVDVARPGNEAPDELRGLGVVLPLFGTPTNTTREENIWWSMP